MNTGIELSNFAVTHRRRKHWSAIFSSHRKNVFLARRWAR